MPVERVHTWIWREGAASETDGTLVSVSETSADGAMAWHTAFGRESHTRTEIDPVDRTRTVTSVAADGTSSVVRHRDGRLEATASYDAAGALLAEATYVYDAHGRQQAAIRNPGTPTELTTTFVHDEADRIVSTTVAAGGLSQTTVHEYDELGRRVRTVLPGGIVQHAAYDRRGQLVAAWGEGRYPVGYAYDPQGRMVAMTTWKQFDQQDGTGIAASATTSWLYNPRRGWLDRKEYADGSHCDFSYTRAGRLGTRTWARGLTTTYSFDAAGRPALVDYSDATPDVATTYRRDGTAATIADASGTRTLSYNADGSPATIAYTTGPLAGHVLAYARDPLGRPAGHTLENGVDTLAAAVYSYDSTGRLATVSPGPASSAPSFTYTYTPGIPNQVATVAANHGNTNVLTTTKTYDFLDRLGEVTAVGILADTLSSHAYQYNDKNQRTKATLAGVSTWDYAYDALGQVTGGIKKRADGPPLPGLAFGYRFDAIGNRLSSTEDAAITKYTANPLNQYTTRKVSGVVHVRGRADDRAIVTARPTIDGTPVALPTPATRLGEAFHIPLPVDNAAAPFVGAAEVTAVLPGTAPGGEDIVAVESRKVRIPQTSQTLTYDLDGNLASDGLWTYTWNAENRLVAMESSSALPAPRSRLTFAYDSQGRRFRKTVSISTAGQAWIETSDTLYLYDNWNLVAELDASASNAPIRTHTWGLDLSGTLQGAGGVGGLLSSFVAQAPRTTLYACYDGNGNVTAYVDVATGAKSATFDYDPFGNTVVAEGTNLAALPFRFSTKYTDSETGLYYYGLRFYSPQFGRWINRDPIGEAGGNNLMLFCNNAPALSYDLLGEWTRNIHYDATKAWAETVFSASAANRIATFDNQVDSLPGGTSPAPGWLGGDQSYHFNRPWGTTIDSRLKHHEDHFAKAKEYCSDSTKKDDPRKAAQELGISLHPLQDYYAHGDYGRLEPGDVFTLHNSKAPGYSQLTGNGNPGGYPDDPLLDAFGSSTGRPDSSEGAIGGIGMATYLGFIDKLYVWYHYTPGTLRINATKAATLQKLNDYANHLKTNAKTCCRCRKYFGVP